VPNPRLQRTRSALLRAPLSRKPLGGPVRTLAIAAACTLVAWSVAAQTQREAEKAIAAFEAAHPGVEKVGGSVKAAKLVRQPKPQFPEAPRKGVGLRPIMLIAVVSENGDVLDPTIVMSADRDLDRHVLDAVRKSKYQPARKDGKPVKSFITITVTLDPGPA